MCFTILFLITWMSCSCLKSGLFLVVTWQVWSRPIFERRYWAEQGHCIKLVALWHSTSSCTFKTNIQSPYRIRDITPSRSCFTPIVTNVKVQRNAQNLENRGVSRSIANNVWNLQPLHIDMTAQDAVIAHVLFDYNNILAILRICNLDQITPNLVFPFFFSQLPNRV